MKLATTEDAAAALAALQRVIRHSSRELAIHPRQGWVAVPNDVGGDFSTADGERIARTAEETNDTEIWVIAGIKEPYEVYAVTAAANELREARNMVATTDAVFLPRSERWLYLASEAEFGVALGAEASVALLTGRDSAEARSAFQRYLGDWQSVPPILHAVADAPWETYPELVAGQEFIVRWS